LSSMTRAGGMTNMDVPCAILIVGKFFVGAIAAMANQASD
jgi:hypothetical protein